MARIAVLLVVLIFTGWSSASAQAAYDDPQTPEGWAWAKIRNDEIADFTARSSSSRAKSSMSLPRMS